MKKDLIKLTLLILTLLLISTIVLLHFGKTYTVELNLVNKDCDLELINDSGEAKLLESKIIDNKYVAKIEAQKAGRVELKMYCDDYQSSSIFYIHKSMIITYNTYFGKSTGSEILPVSLLIILVYIINLLRKKYKYHVHENLYQYKNITYLGIIIFLTFLALNNLYSLFDYQGLLGTVNDIISLMSFISFILLPLAFLTFVMVTISNVKLIMKEGMSLKNLLGLFLGIVICVSTLFPNYLYLFLMQTQKVDIYNLNSIGPYLYNFIEFLIYLFIAYLEFILIATIIIAIKSVKKKPSYNKDYMIILGCKIRKDGTLTPLLKGRVDRALSFRNEQLSATGKDLIFIPSGGQGQDEIMAEGEAMKKYLLEQGIDENNIIVESKSTNTYENIKFSSKLMKKKNANICYSTTNYHVLRAGLIATEQGLKVEGIGSKTKAYFWINAFIREFIGTLYSEKKKHLIMLSIFAIIIIIMITITYFANNI